MPDYCCKCPSKPSPTPTPTCLTFRILLSSRVYLWLGSVLIDTDGAFKNPFWKEFKEFAVDVEEDPKTPVITFGTMGTTHSVREYGAGRSGLNDTTGRCISLFPAAIL